LEKISENRMGGFFDSHCRKMQRYYTVTTRLEWIVITITNIVVNYLNLWPLST